MLGRGAAGSTVQRPSSVACPARQAAACPRPKLLLITRAQNSDVGAGGSGQERRVQAHACSDVHPRPSLVLLAKPCCRRLFAGHSRGGDFRSQTPPSQRRWRRAAPPPRRRCLLPQPQTGAAAGELAADGVYMGLRAPDRELSQACLLPCSGRLAGRASGPAARLPLAGQLFLASPLLTCHLCCPAAQG